MPPSAGRRRPGSSPQGPGIVPIPGSRAPERAVENSTAADLNLTDADLTEIAKILPVGGFGARHPDITMPQWD